MRDIVTASEAPFRYAWQLVNEYMKVCPDNVWAAKNGGYPVWQQMLHAIWVVDALFVCDKFPTALPVPADMDTLLFKKVGEGVVSKAAVQEYAGKVIERVDSWLAALTDADLPKKNEALSAKLGKDFTMAGTLIAMAAHTQYHIGSCDSALRDNGLQGVY